MTKQPFNTQAERRAKLENDQVRFRIRVSGVGGSLKNLMQSADELTKRVLEDNSLSEKAAAMADEFRRQIKTLNRDDG